MVKLWIAAAVMLAAFMGMAVRCQADDAPLSMTSTDILLLGGDLAVTGLDFLQTRYISAHPGSCNEANPILGTHPSLARVDTYFPVAMAVEVAASFALPEIIHLLGGGDQLARKTRTIAQSVFIGVESTVVLTNFRYGVKFNF